MERYTARATRELIEREGISVVEEPGDQALDREQDLVYDAWETEGEARVELAVRALEISLDSKRILPHLTTPQDFINRLDLTTEVSNLLLD